MTTSQNSAASEEPNFEQALKTVEDSLHALKDRYAQVRSAQERQSQLQQRQQEIVSDPASRNSPDLRSQLRKIEEELEALELDLESQLFSWSGLKEVFWQAVRFGGLGVAIGWGLAFWTIKTPKIDSPNPAAQSSAPVIQSPTR